MLGQVCVDLPRARGVRVGQCVGRYRGATKAHVIQPWALRAQIDLYAAQRFSISQLSEGHGKELIQTRKILHLVIATMGGNAATKCTQRQVRHELALVHKGQMRKRAKDPQSDIRDSNRDQTEMQYSTGKSLTHDVLMLKRWDTTDFIFNCLR